MEKQAIIEKIRKLTALAQNAGTEAEAQAALERTEALLTKYNLSYVDIEEQNNTDNVSEQEICRDSTANKWMMYMTPAIADIYFCMPLLRKHGRKGTMTLIGRPENIEACVYILACVRDAGNKAAKRFKIDSHQTVTDKDVRDFKRAFAMRIAERCRDIQKASERRNAEEVSRAMTVVDYRKHEYERLKKASGCSTPSRRRTVRMTSAISAAKGMHAAEGVSLGRDTLRQRCSDSIRALPFFK